MDDILSGKPEVSPPVVVNGRTGTTSQMNTTTEPKDACPETRKRKFKDGAESPASKRHRESMEFRQTAHMQFMELMAKLIDKL